MNVQVLGEDVCYGASLKTVFRKQAIEQGIPYRGEHLSGSIWEGIGGIVKGIGKAVSSDTGRAVTSAVLTASAGRITPTDKANIAAVQQAAGIPPQTLTSGGSTFIKWPTEAPQASMMVPFAIGGIALLGMMMLLVKR